MPESRPMPAIGPRCHELRIGDTVTKREFRVVYYVGKAAIVILEVFGKTTRTTPQTVIDQAKKRLRQYQALAEGSDQ
jgi:phage-related protein